MSPDDKQPRYPASARLAGFLKLLTTADGDLPEASPEILQFLEHAAAGEVSDSDLPRVAEEVRRRLIADRLRAVGNPATRPLGVHLRAKRAAARLDPEPVASALGLEEAVYRRIEEERTDPLSLEATILARIAELFSLSIGELRNALRIGLRQPRLRPGRGMARSDRDDFADDMLAVAAQDLVRAGGEDDAPLPQLDRERLEEKVAAVRRLLELRAEGDE